MKFGVLKDIKEGEYRVIATPAEVSMLKGDGHEVYIQRGAGLGAGFQDEAYEAEGAIMVDTMEEIYKQCDFVTKVKEFEPCEFGLLRENQKKTVGAPRTCGVSILHRRSGKSHRSLA